LDTGVGLVRRWADLAVDALAEAREEIDALNVYPVPDGDTGTNLCLTASAARDALAEADPGDVPAALAAYGKGALLGARGNSGVILAEMLGALLRHLARADPAQSRAVVFAEALREAGEASYAAVGEPKEGTMLTVCRAAAEAAGKRATEPGARTRHVVAAAAEAARAALAETPGQLAVLAEAGVVDAGGRGLCVYLESFETAVTGRRAMAMPRLVSHLPVAAHVELSADGPAYEVMYLLDADDAGIPVLRAALAPLGDSLVVSGGDGLWNVHVHVDNVGAAIEAGIAAGRPHRIRVTHFAEQAPRSARAEGVAGRAVVAVSAGPGLAALFREAGATVVEAAPGDRPTAAALLAAIVATRAAEVIVLPNDGVSMRAADIAARTAEADHGIAVAVVPSRAQVQGIAALAVHEPGRAFDQDVLEMATTARHARHGAVTVATRQAITMAGACEPGDVLGVVDSDFAVLGDDLAAVGREVLGRLLGAGGELVTLVSGAEDEDGGLAAGLAAWVEEEHPTVSAMVYDGGQQRYPVLIAVE
jgi:uncharacterized protein